MNLAEAVQTEISLSQNSLGKGGGSKNAWVPSNNGYKVSSTYGWRSDPFTQNKKFHHGIDLATPEGVSLASTVDGTVVYSGTAKKGSGYNGYGNIVVVKDKNGDHHLFGHLQSAGVKVGTKIKKGTFIGKSGNSGKSTGAHLHYEVRKGGKLHDTLDPSKYLG